MLKASVIRVYKDIIMLAAHGVMVAALGVVAYLWVNL